MNIDQRVARLEAIVKAHDSNHKAERRAIDIAATEVDRRLEGMNEFRQQLGLQAATFVTKEGLEQLSRERLRASEQLEARVRQLEMQTANLHARIWMVGAGVSAIVIIINLVLQFVYR